MKLISYGESCIPLMYFFFSCVVADAITGAKYGPGTGVIHITDVSCSGRITDIQDCDSVFYDGRTSNHSQDVGVKCYSSCMYLL